MKKKDGKRGSGDMDRMVPLAGMTDRGPALRQARALAMAGKGGHATPMGMPSLGYGAC